MAVADQVLWFSGAIAATTIAAIADWTTGATDFRREELPDALGRGRPSEAPGARHTQPPTPANQPRPRRPDRTPAAHSDKPSVAHPPPHSSCSSRARPLPAVDLGANRAHRGVCDALSQTQPSRSRMPKSST